MRPVYTLLSILQVVIAVVVIFLVLLHSGKDAGLSGAFGIGGGGSSFGGGSMVERNLDRATVFFSILFALNTLVLLKIQPRAAPRRRRRRRRARAPFFFPTPSPLHPVVGRKI